MFLPAGARAARKRLVLRLLNVFRVCLSVCCASEVEAAQQTDITCAIYYIIRYYANAVYYIAAFGSLQAKIQQTKVVVSCLDGENLVDSRKDPILVAYSY